MLRHGAILAFALALGCAPSAGAAPEGDGGGAEQLPIVPAFDPTELQQLVDRSPFTRRIDADIDLRLTGVATVGGRTIVTVLDTEEDRAFMVSPEANADGWKLVELSYGDGGIADTVATLQTEGGAFVEARFDPAQLTEIRVDDSNKPRDRDGRVIPPRALIDKYSQMNREQRAIYTRWREQMVARDPELDKSSRRFPIVERAIDNILRGQDPPRQ